jgi:ParB family chromosome partitioning protein
MIKHLKIEEIKPSPTNPRYVFDKKGLEALSLTIVQQGIIHPIEVDENNVIICGERRWRAAKMAGLVTIPCTITKGLTPFQKLQRQYVENAQHLDLNVIEKGRAFKEMLKYKKEELLEKRDEKHKSDYHSKGIKELANEVGESPWLVRESIILSDETSIITKAIENSEISYTHIIEANKVLDNKYREALKKKILNNDFPSREVLKDTVELINNNPENAEDLLKKSGEDLKNEIERIVDNEIITKQDLKRTIISQALPYLEDEYKKFSSTRLSAFMEHLRKITS